MGELKVVWEMGDTKRERACVGAQAERKERGDQQVADRLKSRGICSNKVMLAHLQQKG